MGLAGGPLPFGPVALGPRLPGLAPAGTAVLASTLWNAPWWITETVPSPVTSLLPVVLFPTTDGGPSEDSGSPADGGSTADGESQADGESPADGKSPADGEADQSATDEGAATITGDRAARPGAGTVEHSEFGVALMLAIAFSASIRDAPTPIGTPPNAIVSGSGYVSIPEMARVGIWLNLIGIVLLTLATYFWLPVVWGL